MFDKENLDILKNEKYYDSTLSDYRLKRHVEEIVALQFLNEHKVGSVSLRDHFMYGLLNMGGGPADIHRNQQTEKEINFGKEFKKYPELLESSIDTIWQWFGTAVGQSILIEFLSVIRYVQEVKSESFKELPKLINSENKTIAKMARWRLENNE